MSDWIVTAYDMSTELVYLDGGKEYVTIESAVAFGKRIAAAERAACLAVVSTSKDIDDATERIRKLK